MGHLIGVTGTGTGVGKTVLTALLTVHLRGLGRQAIAIKPFCAGSWDDPRLLQAANDRERNLEEITPVYCSQGLAPLAALGEKEASQAISIATQSIEKERAVTEVLLIEGIGGVAVPITTTDTIGDVLHSVGAHHIVVGVNRLGVINEVVLTAGYLKSLGGQSPVIVLMEEASPDSSAASNLKVIRQVLGHDRLCTIPFLSGWGHESVASRAYQKELGKTLAQILSWVNVRPVDGQSGVLL